MKDWIYNEAINLLQEGEKAKAAQIIAKYIKRYPHDVQAWLLLSDALEDEKKVEFAINKALEIEPTNEVALEKFNQLKKLKKDTTNFFDSPFIDFNSNSEESNQSQSFVYTPEYDKPVQQQQPLIKQTDVEKNEKKDTGNKPKKEKEKDANETGNKLIGTFFLLILFIGLVTATYITKSLWVPKLLPFFERPQQIYLETFQENKNLKNLVVEFNQASTEVAIYLNPSPTPFFTPTPMPTLTNNEIVASQVKNQVDQIKLLSDVSSPRLSQIDPNQMLEKYAKTYSDDEIEKMTKVWTALGWIEPTFDLKTYLENNQLIFNAKYDLTENVIYINDPNFSLQTQSDYAYAYSKYLQTFGIMKMSDTSTMSNDQLNATSAFYDGDARFTQSLFEQTISDQTQFRTDDFKYTDWAIPPALFAQSNFSFQYGKAFIESIYQNGQMIGVQTAYSNPPQTTEQIMHIEKYYAKELGITIPSPDLLNELGSNWNLVGSDSIGEWGTYQILHNNSKANARIDEIFAQSAAAGWGGDRYQVFENSETGQTVLVIQWIMDSDIDANELTTALNQSNLGRFTYSKPTINGTVCNAQTPYTSCVFTKDRHVLWVVSPDETLIPTIVERYPSIQ